ncbi:MAG: hypothetical protein ACHP7H_00395 [Hyphomicrobiales bacterium]
MRTTFNITASGGLVSKLRGLDVPHDATKGLIIELTEPFATDFGVVPAGAKGIVDHVDEEDGVVWIRMVGCYPALVYWDNLLALVPFECEDLVASIKLSVDKKVPCVSLMQRREIAPCICIILQLF